MDDCQAPEHLLTFFKELKMVFDVCDEDADGFIRTEDFVQLGSAFGTGEEVWFFLVLDLHTTISLLNYNS